MAAGRKAVVLLAFLASVELLPDVDVPQRLVNPFRLINVPADGRCWWSAVWLGHRATKAQLFGWFNRKRNHQGVPLSGPEGQDESKLVMAWALGIENMPPECHKRLLMSQMVQSGDMETSMCLSKPFQMAFCPFASCFLSS